MISQRCRHQGRGSVFNRCFTSSIDTCAAAWVTLAIPFLLLLCQDLLLILPQIADWYQKGKESLRFPTERHVRWAWLHSDERSGGDQTLCMGSHIPVSQLAVLWLEQDLGDAPVM